VRDAEGKVIGVCSTIDGKIRSPDGTIIGVRDSDGQIKKPDGLIMQGVKVS